MIGANCLTDGAASVAKRFRIPSIVIGLTIVAFGTSAPELTVSVSSALKGSADIAVGNVVGSNIFNTLMIVGCTALFAPIVITRNTLRKEIPLCILSSIVLLICANDVFLNKASSNILSISDGLILLCFFTIFLGYTFAIASPTNNTQPEEEIKSLPMWKSVLFILGGLAGLIFGGQWFVEGASITGAPVRREIAMTGEVTLRGRVLPIGGLKEKTMAAYRSGIKTVFLPADNVPDLEEIDPTVRAALHFVPVEQVDSVLAEALELKTCDPLRDDVLPPPESGSRSREVPTFRQ